MGLMSAIHETIEISGIMIAPVFIGFFFLVNGWAVLAVLSEEHRM
jgi:hypothetical protein